MLIWSWQQVINSYESIMNLTHWMSQSCHVNFHSNLYSWDLAILLPVRLLKSVRPVNFLFISFFIRIVLRILRWTWQLVVEIGTRSNCHYISSCWFCSTCDDSKYPCSWVCKCFILSDSVKYVQLLPSVLSIYLYW